MTHSSILSPWFAGGRLEPLNKKDGGLRPLVLGEILKAIIFKYIMVVCKGAALDELHSYQLGFSPVLLASRLESLLPSAGLRICKDGSSSRSTSRMPSMRSRAKPAVIKLTSMTHYSLHGLGGS